MNDILLFEHQKGFDRTRTIRIGLRQRISRTELEKIFEEYNIDWNSLAYLFRKNVEKIQFIFFQCINNQEAKKLYADRSKLVKKYEKMEMTITCLMEPIEEIIKKTSNPEFSGILTVPFSNMIISKNIPKKSQRNEEFFQLIINSLGITKNQVNAKQITQITLYLLIVQNLKLLEFNQQRLLI